MTALLVDARGHRCPVPSLRLQKALATSAPDQVLLLLTDDPLARIDVPHLISRGPHRLEKVEEGPDGLRFTVVTGAPPEG